MVQLTFLRGFVVCVLLGVVSTATTPDRPHRRPLILAHRGTSGTHPEESSGGYERAIELGTDFLECDLQASKDGVLICSHEPNLSFLITDIEEDKHRTLFPLSDRHEETIDEATGAEPTLRSGWFIPDYTWEAIKTLRLVQRYIERDNQYDNTFPLITLDELIDLGAKSGKGIYIESKDSTWYQSSRNINLPELMVKNLCARGFCNIVPNKNQTSDGFLSSTAPANDGVDFTVVEPVDHAFPCPIFLQTFCYDDLVYWNKVGVSQFIPTAALIYDANNGTSAYGDIQHRAPAAENVTTKPNVKLNVLPVDLEDLKRLHVAAFAPDKFMLMKRPAIVEEVHAAGFDVHPWTVRNEVAAVMLQNKEGTFNRTHIEKNIDPKFEGDVYKELKFFTDMNVDAVFADYAGTVHNFLALHGYQNASASVWPIYPSFFAHRHNQEEGETVQQGGLRKTRISAIQPSGVIAPDADIP